MSDASAARGRGRLIVALALSLALVAATVAAIWVAQRPDTQTKGAGCAQRFPGDPCAGSLYYGASVEGGDPAPLESLLGRPLTLFRSYQQADTPVSEFAQRASADIAAGRIPLISTKVPASWAEVAAGQQDAWLIERVEALAAVDGPVWLTLHHEPQADGPPADWVAMQQHAREIIDAHSSNIALVGILNGSSFLLPGRDPDAYNMPVGSGVHVMGFDSYNPWSPQNDREWSPAAKVLSPALVIKSWGYPVLVGEYGVRTDPEQPGRARRWLASGYQFALTHDLVGMSYFHSSANSPDGSWALDGERLEQFATNLNRAETTDVAATR